MAVNYYKVIATLSVEKTVLYDDEGIFDSTSEETYTFLVEAMNVAAARKQVLAFLEQERNDNFTIKTDNVLYVSEANVSDKDCDYDFTK